MLLLRARVDLGAIAVKGYSTFLKIYVYIYIYIYILVRIIGFIPFPKLLAL